MPARQARRCGRAGQSGQVGKGGPSTEETGGHSRGPGRRARTAATGREGPCTEQGGWLPPPGGGELELVQGGGGVTGAGRRGAPQAPLSLKEESVPLTGPFLSMRPNLKTPLGLAAGPSRTKRACLGLIPGSPRGADVPASLLGKRRPQSPEGLAEGTHSPGMLVLWEVLSHRKHGFCLRMERGKKSWCGSWRARPRLSPGKRVQP